MRIKTYKAKRMVCLSMAVLFILSDITAWASHDAYDTTTLAPSTSLRQEEFKSRFLNVGVLLSHDAVNTYIKGQIERIIELKGEGWLKEHVTEGVVPIPGLLKRTAQFAHLGLGRKYAKPVIYVDADIYDDKSSLEEVIKHELDERDGWEDIRHSLVLEPSGMRQWIRAHISSQDPKLSGTKYAGLTSVEIARKIHESAHSLGNLYKKYSERIDICEDYLLKLLRIYGEGQESAREIFYEPKTSKDVNIAAQDQQKISSEADRMEVAASWIEKESPELKGKIIMSLSMEGNLSDFEGYPAQDANTKGGMGAYAGDKYKAMADISGRDAGNSRIIKDPSGDMHLEWASEDGMHPIGAQPGYAYIIKDGKKTKVDYDALVKDGIMEEVLIGKDAIMVRAWDEDPEARTEDDEDRSNPKVKVEVYRVNNGGTWVYIFRSKVLDILYNDDRVRRFTQEIVFGKAVYQFAKKLNIIPDILHLNEAHTVVAAAQMRADDRFNDMAIVYTVHTIVPAGLETFSAASLNTDINRMMYVVGLPAAKAEDFRSIFLRPDGVVDFCRAAMKLADIINAVSDEHARAVEKLFKNMYGGEFNKPVVGVLNGSGPAWKSDRLKAAEKKGPPGEDKLMRIHYECKKEAYQEICRRTGVRLDPDKPTFWAVRRLVEYKSQYPMLRFIVHILTADRDKKFTRDELKAVWLRDIPSLGYNRDLVESVLNNIFKGGERKTVNGLGAQIVVGGPVYMDFWEQEFKRWSNDIDELKGRFVYVPHSDAKLIKMQAIGSDVCITMPKPLDEACGTSDQRTGLNGGVNIAIKGAGPAEWIIDYSKNTQDGCGFLIGSYIKETPSGPEADIPKFYNEAPADIFDKCEASSGLFYENKSEWKRLMHNSYMRANEIVSAAAMEERYARKVYLPAVRSKRNKKIINEIVIRDYCDEAAGISGLKNAEKELAFLAEAGVRYVSLIGLMSNSGSPFEVIDSMAIDKLAGSFEDLRDFVNKAHALGIFVIMDWLANQHVHKANKICEDHPERFLYTNVSDGNYWLDPESRLYRGKDIPAEELHRRIELGKRILEGLKKIPEDKLRGPGKLEIGEFKIAFQPGDREIRKRVSGAQNSVIPIIVPEACALFPVNATDLVTVKTDFPRRFGQLAQPDLGHPDVIKNSIEIGRFWLGRGLDGFRVDAALSTFPDRIKENWGIEVYENLTGDFIKEMRRVRPDCFFLFEGFEKQKELLALAGDTGCAVYAGEIRRYITDALTDGNKISNLTDYLRNLERVPSDIKENMVNLGPEHDAFHYEDAWAKLSYQDKNIMYFLYGFLPGYSLIFDGEIYGAQYAYKNELNRTAKAPLLADSDPAIRDARRRIFSFPMAYKQLLSGRHSYLETDASWHAMGVARFDDNDILIGAFNVTQNSGRAALSLKRIINTQIEPAPRESFYYIKESLQLDKDGRGWIPTERQEISAEKLFSEGISVSVGPKGCEIIRLKKVAVPISARKGSPAQCFKYLFDNKVFSKDKALTVRQLKEARGYSKTTIRIELKALSALGIVKIMNTSKGKSYYLNENFGRAPPETALEVFNKIFSIEKLNRYIVPEKHIPLLSRRIKNILKSLIPEHTAALGEDRTFKTVNTLDDALEGFIRDQSLIALFNDAWKRKVRPSKDKIAKQFIGRGLSKNDFSILKYDDAILTVFYEGGRPYRVIRYSAHSYVDNLSAPRLDPKERHSANILNNGFKFEILRDRSEVLSGYLEEIKMYYENPILRPIVNKIWSGDYYLLEEAVTDLRRLVYEFKSSPEASGIKIGEHALKLLHALMYHDNKGVRVKANRALHDIYTGRPEEFPQTKSYKTVLQNEEQTITVPRLKGEEEGRVRWVLNGEIKSPIQMVKSKDDRSFSAVIPVGIGTIHYAVEVRISGKWRYKTDPPQALGVIKTQKDARGKNVLEVRTAIFDLPKGPDGKVVRREDGSLVISSFKELEKKLPELKKLNYDAIWLMDFFEWGPISYPGRDPSSFAPLDHITIAKELGGEKGLEDLKKEADKLGIELVVNLIPHISQTNHSLPAYFPAYCYDDSRNLVKRASSDGMGDWFDSFQPNWRRKEVLDHYVDIVLHFANMGMSFRADIGHAFDTTFKIDRSARGLAAIFGDIVTTERRGDGLFRTTDLSGSDEANVILSKLSYEIQKQAPNTNIYSENFATKMEDGGWHANDKRLVISGVIPYNSLHEELAHVLRDSGDVSGVINHILYRRWIQDQVGGQHVTIYASHDYQRDPQTEDEMYRDRPPLQLYGDAIIPFMASVMLLNYNGPIMWHFARLLGEEYDSIEERHNKSLAEFWKIWVNNIREFDFEGAVRASEEYIKNNPKLARLGEYIVAIRKILQDYDLMRSGYSDIVRHDRDCVSIFKKSWKGNILSFINYGYHSKDIYRRLPDIADIKDDQFYEIKELFRYNKQHGLLHAGAVTVSGLELKHLGLHEKLLDWETLICAITPVDMAAESIPAYKTSLTSYKNFGLEDRVRYSLVAVDLADSLKRKDFADFKDCMVRIIKIARRVHDYEIGEAGTILFDIARFYPEYKDRIIEYLTKIALDQDTELEMETRYDMVRILRSANIGEVAMVSLEARDIAGLGGLALYIKDMTSALVGLGLDTTIFTNIFEYDREGRRIFENVIKNAGLEYTGRSIAVPFYGESKDTLGRFNTGYIYKTMLGGKVKTFAIANTRYCNVLYGGLTAEDLARRYRYFSLGALEAIRTMNIHPTTLQTNEGATGFAIPYLTMPAYGYLANDPHFKGLKTMLHVNHNLDRNYQNIITGSNNRDKDHLMRVAGLCPEEMDHRLMITSELDSLEINPAYAANNRATDSATVAPGYRDYTADNSRGIGLGDVLSYKRGAGRYFGFQNGIDTVIWQKRILRQHTFFECVDRSERQKLFQRSANLKASAKDELQVLVGLVKNPDACLFTMLHRLCEQKGYEIAIDAIRKLLNEKSAAQVVVGGPAEDTDQGRWFKKQLEEMQNDQRYSGRFRYVGEVSPNSRLYELMYLGADIFLMPSKFEPAGLSQLEALAAGAVVVARDVDGLATSIIDVDEAPIRKVPPNGFKFFEFSPGKFENAMERALAMFRDRKNKQGRYMSEWEELVYNAFTYDSRWIRPAKQYINGIFAKNENIDTARVVDTPELLLIFKEAQDEKKDWAGGSKERESLEKRLIQHGYNTPRGLDHVVEDAVKELENISKDEREAMPLIKKLAKKYYEEYRKAFYAPDTKSLGADSQAAISRITDKRVSAALEVLSFKAISDKMASGMVYEIRYNEDRIRECPQGEDIIKEYVKLLKGRSSMSSNVILIPSNKKVKLLSILSYKDKSDRSAGEVFGEGVVDIECGAEEIPLLGILDIAFAASNIRSSVRYSDMDESEKKLIRFIKEECLVITGLKTDDIKDDMILEFIKSLPKPAPIPIDIIEHNNRLILQKLQQAALSPELRLTQKEFEEEYLIRAVLLSHGAVNRYIRGHVNPHNEGHIDITALNEYRPDKIYVENGNGLKEREIAIVGIPGLLKNTGQLAHVGLGRKNGKPVIYVDSQYFNNEAVLKHDKDEIGKWEAFREKKGLTYDGMRNWIRQYITVPDPIEGISSRQIAERIHSSSHNIDHIYAASAAALLDLVNIYKAYSDYGADENSADINIAAAVSVYKNFEEALDVFKAGDIPWDRVTIEIRKEFVSMLAKSAGKEPRALKTSDFGKKRVEFNNKSLWGLLQNYMNRGRLSAKNALKALKEKLDIGDLGGAPYENFKKALEAFKADDISWDRATTEIRKEFVFMLAKSLGKEPGALKTSDFRKFVPEFNDISLHGLLWKYMDRGRISDKNALKALKEELDIEDIPKARWQEKKRDWDRVSGIIKEIYGLDVTGETNILNWLRQNRLNKEAGIALCMEIRQGDSAARDSLAAAYENVIKYFAGKLHSKNPDIAADELFQEGRIAISRCAERFDPDRGASFYTFISGYAAKGGRKTLGRIEGSMLDFIRSKRGTRRKSRNEHQYTPTQDIEEDMKKSYMDRIIAEDTPNNGITGDERQDNKEEDRTPLSRRELEISISRIIGPAIEYLIAIRDDKELLDKALDKKAGIPLEEKFSALKGLGVFVPLAGRRGYFRFADMMVGPDEDYTKTLINAISNELKKCPATTVIEAVKMAVIHEINKRPAIVENKALWHIVEKGVIPTPQRSTIITRVNKAFRENKDATEKIWVIEEGKSIKDAINEIRSDDPGALIDIALSNEEHIDNVPDDKSLKMLVFKPQGDYIQLEGVIAALRALHSDNALPTLLRLYSVMAQESFNNPPDAISDNPKEFARRIIFVLPRTSSALVNDIPKLNERLLKLLTAA